MPTTLPPPPEKITKATNAINQLKALTGPELELALNVDKTEDFGPFGIDEYREMLFVCISKNKMYSTTQRRVTLSQSSGA